MIDLELLFLILTELKQEAIDGITSPPGRDAFAFGAIHGQMQALSAFEARLRAEVSKFNNHEDDEA